MKGIIFNLAEDVLSHQYGADMWDDILDRTGLEGVYTSLGSYPDDEFTTLIVAASEILHADSQTVIRELGKGAIPLLAERYPEFFVPHATTRSFVLTLNEIIHPEVRKLYPGADVPEFDFDTNEPDVLVLGYQSARRLCALAEGFVDGAARHYGEVADVEQTECMHRGQASCKIRCRFSRKGDG